MPHRGRHNRRRHSRKLARHHQKKRKKAVHDRHMGHHGHTKTVNAPKTW